MFIRICDIYINLHVVKLHDEYVLNRNVNGDIANYKTTFLQISFFIELLPLPRSTTIYKRVVKRKN